MLENPVPTNGNADSLVVALVGNPNVGKSSIFNQLTGLNQSVGNWPGKTVELAEGILIFKGTKIKVVDLPGTYSLSSFSEEEVVTRDFVLSGEPNVIVDIVDASALERNLYLTLQLLEMGAPVVIALNFVDEALKKGIEIKTKSLSEELGVPVVSVVATTGLGLSELVDAAIAKSKNGEGKRPHYGKEVEGHIIKLANKLQEHDFGIPESCPSEWVAIKLLEGDLAIKKKFPLLSDLEKVTDQLTSEIEELHGEPANVIISSERYSLAHRIVERSVHTHAKPINVTQLRLDNLLTHRVFGYIILFAIMGGIFFLIFAIGGFASSIIDAGFRAFNEALRPALNSFNPLVANLILNGIVFGIGAAASIALPYIATFYFLLSILEDTGYLPRAAFLLDSLMHKIGLHGKAFIPMLLGYGCSVPACIGCRIMETKKERLLLGVLVLLIPCSARTVIILGVVGTYIGVLSALAIYVLDLLIVLILGRLLFKILPGESVGLIMEMPRIRTFKPKLVLKRTWFKTKDFLYMAMPLIIIGSLVVELARVFGIIDLVVGAITPITVGLLGLPASIGIALIFGFLRKELALIMLATYVGTTNFAIIMSPAQMIVFTIVMVLYIPCIATLAALVKEYGIKKAMLITLMDVGLALGVGFLAMEVLRFTGF